MKAYWGGSIKLCIPNIRSPPPRHYFLSSPSWPTTFRSQTYYLWFALSVCPGHLPRHSPFCVGYIRWYRPTALRLVWSRQKEQQWTYLHQELGSHTAQIMGVTSRAHLMNSHNCSGTRSSRADTRINLQTGKCTSNPRRSVLLGKLIVSRLWNPSPKSPHEPVCKIK